MKTVILSILVLLAAASVQAQTTATATWNMTEVPAIAGSYTNTMQIDTTAPVALTAACVPAVAPATGSVCSAPLAVTGPTASHSYVLLVCNTTFCSAASANGAPPGLGGLKIKLTVIIGGDDDDSDDQ